MNTETKGNGSLVLIVEDNEKNLKLARDVLQFHGFRTIEATTGEEGVAMAVEQRPDLVLMDIALPGMDGVDATRALKSDAPTRSSASSPVLKPFPGSKATTPISCCSTLSCPK